MRKIVLINQSSGYLMIDIVNAYAEEYDRVVLITGSLKAMERRLDNKVKLDYVITYNRSSALRRIFTWGWATLQLLFKLLFSYRGYEIVYVTNPPMCYLLSLIIRNSFSLIVYDVYPEALRNVGVKETDFLYQLWTVWNKKLFKRAKMIVTLSEGMKKQLATYVNADKIRVISNWAGSEAFKPIRKEENFFAQEYELQNKFVVMYSGNIGYTHHVEAIVEIAQKLLDEKDIYFLIIGEGKKKKVLQEKAKQHGLTSCLFLTWQSKEILPYSLACADLAVITLNEETAVLSVPSKTYNLMAVGAPLLCIAPQQSELSALIEKHGNGHCFQKDKIQQMADYILYLKSNPEKRALLSTHSLKASTEYTYKNARNYV